MRMLRMLSIAALTALAALAQISPENATRIGEYYRVADKVQDRLWLGWSSAPKSLLLVTPQTEFLTHYGHPPAGFKSSGGGFSARPRTFDPGLQATFPAFDGEPVVVIGEPKSGSTPWVFTVIHEHFHQLQDSQPGYFAGVAALGLSKGDKTGMWMLNYAFPYERADLKGSFHELRDALLKALSAPDGAMVKSAAAQYAETRRRFLAQVTEDEARYFEFQLWQEGIARYTEIQAAEDAVKYQPTAKFAALPDYTPFAAYSGKIRQNTLDELRNAELADAKRGIVYPLGAAEGLLLDRINIAWKTLYFDKPFSMGPLFAGLLPN